MPLLEKNRQKAKKLYNLASGAAKKKKGLKQKANQIKSLSMLSLPGIEGKSSIKKQDGAEGEGNAHCHEIA
jgi:hypothetical protein